MSNKKDIKRYSKICAYCNYEFKEHSEKNVSYVFPVSMGGKRRLSNIVCCCNKCSLEKNSKHFYDWIKLKDIRKHLMIYLFSMKNFKKGYTVLLYKKFNSMLYLYDRESKLV